MIMLTLGKLSPFTQQFVSARVAWAGRLIPPSTSFQIQSAITRKRRPVAVTAKDWNFATPNQIHKSWPSPLRLLLAMAETLGPRRRSDNKSAKQSCRSSHECSCGYLRFHAGTIDGPSACDDGACVAECPLRRAPAS